MLEYAYGLKSFHFLEGIAHHETLVDVYERLAHILARRVIDRARRGLYRSYVPRAEQLPFVRERLDVQRVIRQPWRVHPYCHYHLHTPDVEENQILAWTLHTLRRSGLKRPEVSASVRRAARSLQGSVTPLPFTAADCAGRTYTRLNDDYHPMHALCRFFLEHTGPSLHTGSHTMLPFLVDMAQLFESFVAAWLGLERRLPRSLGFRAQDRHTLTNGTNFSIDLVLYDVRPDGTLGPARCVLDTKYKAATKPANADIYQVTTYALAKGCREAVLVYPAPLAVPLDEQIGDVRVRSLTFSVAGDLDRAGVAFLNDLQSS